jgi:hypothetical protein
LSVLRDGVAWLHSQRHSHMTVDVVYARGAITVNIKATPTAIRQSVNEATDAQYSLSDTREFLIYADDLVISGTKTKPVRGDQIRETLDGATVVFEVMPSAGEDVWRWSDVGQTVIRVLTKRKG